ncbi:MAG: sulfatase-like hydrolase/transferase [Erysipelotrichaceae bacterium]|nr:sulfatase-like hydrolase/transferase [Erysipelotrichaceae bacterium]
MDICLYVSDQHACQIQGYAGNRIVRTPNLDRIAAEGTAFLNAHAAYPVCVPSRMSMLTGQYASQNGVMSNHGSLNSNIPTFLHSLDSAGYQTVLCGRMHFIGPDQRHGFTSRIAGDITQIYNNRPQRIAEERGVHDKTLQGGPSSVSLIGGGNSPTLEYDRYVTGKALEYLSQDHNQPMFLCVGTYAPHHPFVAPEELFNYYYDKVTVDEESFLYPEHPALKNSFRDASRETVRAVMAAYYGMVEFEDRLIGQVYDAFQAYLKRTEREGVFIYLSDHGEHEGYRGMYGKNTLYDCSVRVPLLFAGSGINRGVIKQGCVSLLDISPTVCDLAKAEKLPFQSGKSLLTELLGNEDDMDRTVFAEVGGNITMGQFSYGQMAVNRHYKYIHYAGYDNADVLYDRIADPEESINVLEIEKETAGKLKQQLNAELTESVEQIQAKAKRESEYMKVLRKCDFDSDEVWHCPPSARNLPDPLYSSPITLEKWISDLKSRK